MNTYNPIEFTLSEYERLLLLAAGQYKFISFTELDIKERFVLWRHDIDVSLEQAVKLAQIEKKHKIQSTYFIHLHNDFYNALDPISYDLIKEISSLGHILGLHFDMSYYQVTSLNQLIYWLTFEKNILEALFQKEISAFSFHNPNEFALNFEDHSYAGMVNTYSSYFKKNIQYCSDSNGYWRYKKLADILNDQDIRGLQVLTHPEWWTEIPLNPREKIEHYLEKKKSNALARYDELLKASGRLNIG